MNPSNKADIGRKVVLVEVDADEAGQRVDNFLMARLKGVPRSRVYRLLRKGEVRVNKKRVKPEYKLTSHDVVRIPPVSLKESVPLAAVSQSMGRLLEKSILLELPGLLVVNKPAGLAVHGGSGVNLGLIESLRQLRPNDRYLELVHRLDRDTSGCILVARKRSMLRFLQEELRQRRNIQKYYQALVLGGWPKRKQVVDAPLLRIESADGNRVVKISTEGKPSRTEFKILRRFEDFTLVQAKPVTGRTHQIRVHAQSQGCPLLGDEKYGDDGINASMRKQGFRRLFLHAAALEFTLPDETQKRRIEAPLWPELAEPLAKLKEITG